MTNQIPAPSGVTFNLLSTQCPLPTVPVSVIGASNGSTGPFTQGMTAGVSSQLNILAAKIQTLSQGGSGGFGVLKGLELSIGSGLAANLSAGTAALGDILDYGGGVVSLPPGQTSFIWLTAAGSPTFGANLNPPNGAVTYLGAVTTNATSITGIDYSGRIYLWDGMRVRQTADPFAPGDQPPINARVFTLTQNGMYLWNGFSHGLILANNQQFAGPVTTQTILANWTLTGQSGNTQWLIAEAACDVVLPAPSSMLPGSWFKIVNGGDPTLPAQNYNLTVVTALGQTPVATVAPGQSVTISLQPPSGGSGLRWPTTATVQTSV